MYLPRAEPTSLAFRAFSASVQQLDQPACLGRQIQILGIQLLVIDKQFLVAQAQLLNSSQAP